MCAITHQKVLTLILPMDWSRKDEVPAHCLQINLLLRARSSPLPLIYRTEILWSAVLCNQLP